jgi:hypothetical protein
VIDGLLGAFHFLDAADEALTIAKVGLRIYEIDAHILAHCQVDRTGARESGRQLLADPVAKVESCIGPNFW